MDRPGLRLSQDKIGWSAEKEKTQSNPGEVGRQRLESTVGRMLKLKEYGKRQQQKKTTIEAL